MRWVLFRLVFRPLIARNLRLRAAGKLPDEWYWADAVAIRLGMLRYYDFG